MRLLSPLDLISRLSLIEIIRILAVAKSHSPEFRRFFWNYKIAALIIIGLGCGCWLKFVLLLCHGNIEARFFGLVKNILARKSHFHSAMAHLTSCSVHHGVKVQSRPPSSIAHSFLTNFSLKRLPIISRIAMHRFLSRFGPTLS